MHDFARVREGRLQDRPVDQMRWQANTFRLDRRRRRRGQIQRRLGVRSLEATPEGTAEDSAVAPGQAAQFLVVVVVVIVVVVAVWLLVVLLVFLILYFVQIVDRTAVPSTRHAVLSHSWG